MKLTTLDEDLRIHQKLEDEPNDVGGLSAQALKEKFDQAGVTIQKYLNETHLPEEEKAVADALSEAKAYADEKTKAVEQGNMKTAVYDTKKRRKDIFDYTDEKVEALKARKASGTWICSGTCNVYACLGDTDDLDAFIELTDPDGLWVQTEKAFVAPEGGKIALVVARAASILNRDTEARIHVLVNNTLRGTRSIGYLTSSAWTPDTVVIPVTVETGDKIKVRVEAYRPVGSTNNSLIQIREMSLIVFA